MDDFTNIFDPLDSQAASDEDQDLAIAGEVLVKLAEEEGIDLSQLSETELLGLVNTLRGDGTTDLNDTEPQRKEASHIMDENQITEAQFDALVMQETMKVAAQNEIDLSDLSVEDLAALRMAVASEIAEDPDAYFAKTAAEEEFAQKVAEADYIGRLMAHSFADELGLDSEKLAERAMTAENIARNRRRTEALLASPTTAAERSSARRAQMKAYEGMFDTAAKGDVKPASRAAVVADNTPPAPIKERLAKFKADREGFSGLGTRANDLAKKWGRKLPGAGVVKDPRARLAIAAGLGAGTIGGAAYGAKKLMDKESTLDDLALERAQEFLLSQGIDPSTGEKVAASEAEIDEAVSLRALEILEANGYTFE